MSPSAPVGDGDAPDAVEEARVEAALDEWFANPRWREVYRDGPDVRAYMRRALAAADAVRVRAGDRRG